MPTHSFVKNGHVSVSMAVLPLLLIQEEQLLVNGKKCTISTCTSQVPPGGLHRNSVVKITDLLDMTSAVYHGCKATNQII